ncbi:cupin domain-containing protein [Deinococcus yavapaiensis]|uniref:Quercetin dioxygenase-like cupin family protein n=1 Tax=Deinococcus yavapaiensis KR-236 TaxID=694435 RepID=A0A318S1G7_9DEIO|nr:cupin domain-containing protein [Deinococcus yavapaiensis]PYE51076.1 quercetin dioxygenase-like cupin family protein [Deinococcus yavapaiensis KR-236]
MKRLATLHPRSPTHEDPFDLHADRFRVLISGDDTHGRFATVEVRGRRSFELPVHVHTFEDELVVVLEGELDVRIDEETRRASVGDVVLLPCGVPHEVKLRSDTARLVVTYSPAGFERFLREVSRPASTSVDDAFDPGVPNVPLLVTVGEQYGVTFYPSREC